ncbi:SixA phosphatase family protein [Caulobacter sp. NIBR2454]|uniref:SixA phosphatase family protein n=1 Tax=Caulobacter sp. NIBR2454 TaxID=3015996 RepID=UPI0022B729CA|nr:histidine phosphatase family protein [Caulobacter sp. NIBR2454]
MERLILMRHGAAERRGPTGGDFDRALTAQGRIDAALIGDALAKAGFAPDLALVSEARRAQDTWTAAGESFPKARKESREDFYSASTQTVLTAVEGETAGTVMVVGHNPTLQDLAVGLLKASGASPALIARLEMRFPPATAAAFSFDAAGRAELEGLFYAADHGGRGAE